MNTRNEGSSEEERKNCDKKHEYEIGDLKRKECNRRTFYFFRMLFFPEL